MDTVLGLSVTPTRVGWVLAEGHGAEGVIVDHCELELADGQGLRVVNAAEQMATEVLRAKAVATAEGHRVRVVGIAWSDEASAQAALLLELLTNAGFDNVVPIRLLDALEILAQAIAPVIGCEQTAVCILDHECTTVVMVDIHGGETQTAVKRVRGGFAGLSAWLSGMFDRSGWRPAGVVVVGSGSDVDTLSRQLGKALPVTVFAQAMAQVTVARGAALAAAQSTEFTDTTLMVNAVEPVSVVSRPRQLSYTSAVATLTAAAVVFVVSLALVVGLQLIPDKDPELAENTAHKSVTPSMSQEETGFAASQQDPANRLPRLARVLQHIPGTYGDVESAPSE